MPISIAIVDDHRVVGRSLQAYLESFPDLKLVGIATTGEELLERLDEWRPQVVLQDLLLPGGVDGIETTQRLLARAPDVRVVALTASTDEARMMGVLRAGATGYVRKDAEPETYSFSPSSSPGHFVCSLACHSCHVCRTCPRQRLRNRASYITSQHTVREMTKSSRHVAAIREGHHDHNHCDTPIHDTGS